MKQLLLFAVAVLIVATTSCESQTEKNRRCSQEINKIKAANRATVDELTNEFAAREVHIVELNYFRNDSLVLVSSFAVVGSKDEANAKAEGIIDVQLTYTNADSISSEVVQYQRVL